MITFGDGPLHLIGWTEGTLIFFGWNYEWLNDKKRQNI